MEDTITSLTIGIDMHAKKKYITPLLLLWALPFWYCAHAQSDLQNKFVEYQRATFQEKIFLHTDKESYLTGENLWFSIYAVDGMLHRPINLSKVTYIELLDRENMPVMQIKSKMDQGRGSGSFTIPELPSGKYTIRGYTRWMRNFSAAFFFEKTIAIIHSREAVVSQPLAQDASKEMVVRFFPEGGDLVRNLRSKVAFQVMDKSGRGINSYGFIQSEAGDTVVQFKSHKFGMGNFFFTPLSGLEYQAVMFYNGIKHVHDLPAIRESGYTLQLNEIGNEKLQLVMSKEPAGPLGDTLILIAHTRQAIKISIATIMRQGKAGFLIDKNKLGDGISHFTVFDQKQRPLCERLYFIPPRKKVVSEVRSDKTAYGIRQPVGVVIQMKTSDNTPASGSFSMSVFKVDSFSSPQRSSILSYLLLESDLPGNVESPESYFAENDPGSQESADNLMLTHGWTRFSWTAAMSGKPPAFQFAPEHEGMIVSGHMVPRQRSQSTYDASVYLSFPGRQPEFYAAKPTSKGKFEIPVNDAAGEREAVIQASKSSGAFTFTIDNPYATESGNANDGLLTLTADMRSDFLMHAVHSQAERYFQKPPASCDIIVEDSLMFYDNPDKTYFIADYQRFPIVEDIMREYVPEVTVINQGRRSNLYVLNRKDAAFFKEGPLVMLDGVPFSENFRLAKMSADNLRKIDIVTRRYWLAATQFDGIIGLASMQGDLAGMELDSGAVVFDFQRYHIKREFYAPEYLTESQRNSRIPDFRNVLFWSPGLLAGRDGKREVQFFTSDETGRFIGVIQGISDSGLPISDIFTFTVGEP